MSAGVNTHESHARPVRRLGGPLRPIAGRMVLYVRGKVLKFRRSLRKQSFILRHRDVRRQRRAMAGRVAPDTALASDLRRDGFVDFTAYVDHAAFAALREQMQTWSIAASSKKDFMQVFSSKEEWRSSDPLVRLALEPRLVSLITDYFGEVPYLLKAELIKSTRAATAPRWKQSQLWHKDHNDLKVVKLFIYLNDVDEGNGPFAFVPASVQRQEKLPYYPVHKSDESVERHLGGNFERQITGPIGTSFLIDTARLLHRGSRIDSDRHRIVYVATYTTFAQFVPQQNRIVCEPDLGDLERLLLTKPT